MNKMNTNPNTNTACNKEKNPNPNADRQEPQHTASTNPDTNNACNDLINSPFTSFEEVRAKRQTAQNQYLKSQYFKCVFGSKEERRKKKRFNF